MKLWMRIFRGTMLLFALAIVPATAGHETPPGHWCHALCGSGTGIIGLHAAAVFMLLLLLSFPVAKWLRGESWRLAGWRFGAPVLGIPAGLVLHRVLYAYYDSMYWIVAVAPSPLRAVMPRLPVFRSWGPSLLNVSEYFHVGSVVTLYDLLPWTLAAGSVAALWASFSAREAPAAAVQPALPAA